MSIYGYTTKADLSRMGSFLMMGLFGIIIAGAGEHVPAQLRRCSSPSASSACVVFTGLTAYDTQRIKASYVQFAYAEGTDDGGQAQRV